MKINGGKYRELVLCMSLIRSSIRVLSEDQARIHCGVWRWRGIQKGEHSLCCKHPTQTQVLSAQEVHGDCSEARGGFERVGEEETRGEGNATDVVVTANETTEGN